jgi:hypothetical protein
VAFVHFSRSIAIRAGAGSVSPSPEAIFPGVGRGAAGPMWLRRNKPLTAIWILRGARPIHIGARGRGLPRRVHDAA